MMRLDQERRDREPAVPGADDRPNEELEPDHWEPITVPLGRVLDRLARQLRERGV
jgi:predicted HAD superfamily Cof-like phosphohydrolase